MFYHSRETNPEPPIRERNSNAFAIRTFAQVLRRILRVHFGVRVHKQHSVGIGHEHTDQMIVHRHVGLVRLV